MDLRSLPSGLTSEERVTERRRRVEKELGLDLSLLAIDEKRIGHADERNCEQMFGAVPIPVGYAGPLPVTFSSGESAEIHLPLATTEGALVASVNRGCKALTAAGGVRIVKVTHHGTTRSLALKLTARSSKLTAKEIQSREAEWKLIGESTSKHLKILHYDIDTKDDYLFLTIRCDTDEAMGMNMVTIAAQAIGEWIEKNIKGARFITVAGNVDSDKKPSKRTYELGRGFEIIAEATITSEVIKSVLKSTPEAMLEVAHAKLEIGSTIAGALGKNLHAANVIAALYLATGQDAAHVVEGSMTDTAVSEITNHKSQITNNAQSPISNLESLFIRVRVPALMVGIRGGGTTLPAQAQCLDMLLRPNKLPSYRANELTKRQRLAEAVAAAVLAGEISLLAAQANQTLARAHTRLGRQVRASTEM